MSFKNFLNESSESAQFKADFVKKFIRAAMVAEYGNDDKSEIKDIHYVGYKNGKLTFEAVHFDGNEYITSEYVFTFDHSNTSTSDYFDNEKEASERLKDKKSNLE